MQSVSDYFSSPGNLNVIKELKEIGLNFETTEKKERLSEKLKGCTVVVSGNFSIPREEIKKMIELHSGKNGSSVTSKTTYLLAGEKPGPEKIQKANSLGIKTITEEEFFKLIG